VQFLQLVISGIAQGCIYGLIALGLCADLQGDRDRQLRAGRPDDAGRLSRPGADDRSGFPFWLAVLSAILAMGAAGVALERVVIRPILGQPAFSIVMLTIGIGYVLRGLVTMVPVIGTETHVLPVPYKDQIWKIGTLVLNVEQMVVIACTALLCGLLFAVFKYSKVGIAMQASSQNQLAAYYMGIPVKNSMAWSGAWRRPWPRSPGLLLAPITFVHANMGFVGLKAFPAAVVGGFGSLPGPSSAGW
jgi:branched-chain amino acid transport system permease protein